MGDQMSDDPQDWRAVLEGRREWAVVCGDCLDLLPMIPVGSVGAVVTDPPYGLGNKWQGGTWFTRGVYANGVKWDAAAPQRTVRQLSRFACPVVIWGGNYFRLPPSRGVLAWMKKNAVPTMSDFELAWTNLDRPAKAYRSNCNGWDRLHPTEKPVGLMSWCMDCAKVASGVVVLDPFCGSGTTGAACIATGRRFIGIELDPTYHAIAVDRLTRAAMYRQPMLVGMDG